MDRVSHELPQAQTQEHENAVALMTDKTKTSSSNRGKSKRTGLGRGLGALIPDQPAQTTSTSPTEIGIGEIQPNPYQPRLIIDESDLDELVNSIRAHGVIQPVIVAQDDQIEGYYLIAGERRWRAASLAGLNRVPVIVKDVTPQQMLELALVENVVRSDLSPLEEAQAYQQLIEEFNLTQQDVADRVGRARVTVANTLRLLTAPDRVQAALSSGEITEGHARALLSLPDSFEQLIMLDEVIERQWSVRQTESAVRARIAKSQLPERKKVPVVSTVETNAMLRKLEQRLQTRVQIRQTDRGAGSITISYSGDEHLADLVERIAGEHVF